MPLCAATERWEDPARPGADSMAFASVGDADWRVIAGVASSWLSRDPLPAHNGHISAGAQLRVKLLYGPDPAPSSHAADRLAVVEERYSSIALPPLAIYQMAVAYSLGTGSESRPSFAVTDPAAVAALAAVFDSLWAAASVAARTRGPDADQPSAEEDDLLRLLAAGLIHTAIAHRLGISVRTVRRRINDIHVRLGADSPFQAGYEVARRGWL
jgi:DNA-binding CsgD family transcriptional regulator